MRPPQESTTNSGRSHDSILILFSIELIKEIYNQYLSSFFHHLGLIYSLLHCFFNLAKLNLVKIIYTIFDRNFFQMNY